MIIELLDGTTENPLQCIGKRSGICWNSAIDDPEQNRKRAIGCIRSGHGRVLEFVNVEMVISGMSARAMRELYTHIGGSPTRLQSSTRYVSEEEGFKYFTPPKVLSSEKEVVNEWSDSKTMKEVYDDTMKEIQKGYNTLLSNGIPKEDAANLLPLGMNSKMIWKLNLRTLINFCQHRLCTRAYHEIRKFTNQLRNILSIYDEEWSWICEYLLVPKCEQYKYVNKDMCFCTEAQCCGRHPKLKDMKIEVKNESET